MDIKINPTLIPKLELRVLCAAFLEATLKFYENPENQAGFERWQTKRKGGGGGWTSELRQSFGRNILTMCH